MRALRTLGCALLLTLGACDSLDRKGMVLVTDKSMRATLIGTHRNGFVGLDGLRWRDGRLYMADERGSAVHVWTPGKPVETIADARLGIRSPEDLVLDQDGNLFFTDDDSGGVWQIDAGGGARRLAGGASQLPSTEAIALAPSGLLLVGDPQNRRIASVDRSGKVSTFLGPDHGITKPESMAYDDRGNLFIADNEDNVLYMLSPDGSLHAPVRDREGFSPESIWHAGGELFITDSAHGKLYRYSLEDGLSTIAVFGGELAMLSGVTTDDQGRVYVSVQTEPDQKRGYLIRFDKAEFAAR